MKEKLMYITAINLDDDCSGITRKVYAQFNCFAQAFDAYLIGYKGNNLGIFHNGVMEEVPSGKQHRHYAVLRVAAEYIQKLGCKRIYIRRFFCDPYVMKSLKRMKSDDTKILWEIPTYPYDNQSTEALPVRQKVKFYIQVQIDRLYRTKLKKYVERIVTFSHVNNIFGISTIITGNGVEVSKIRPRKIREKDNCLNMIAVAVMRPWHGYDRLIKGLYRYYQHGGERNIVFHVVGDGTTLPEYRKLVSELGLEDHVTFYGFKTKEEIDEIYDKADIAVESLGWHRSGVPMGTSIKTREYVAKGLPIIASSPMDIFPKGWKYAYYAPIDDSDIDIVEVINFYESILCDKESSALADEIRGIAFEKCDMAAMMQPVIECLIGW